MLILRSGACIGGGVMKTLQAILPVVGLLLASSASAQVQGTDLNGHYRCVQLCRGDTLAAVTQNGRELNFVNVAGEPAPGSIIQRASGSTAPGRARSTRQSA